MLHQSCRLVGGKVFRLFRVQDRLGSATCFLSRKTSEAEEGHWGVIPCPGRNEHRYRIGWEEIMSGKVLVPFILCCRSQCQQVRHLPYAPSSEHCQSFTVKPVAQHFAEHKRDEVQDYAYNNNHQHNPAQPTQNIVVKYHK